MNKKRSPNKRNLQRLAALALVILALLLAACATTGNVVETLADTVPQGAPSDANKAGGGDAGASGDAAGAGEALAPAEPMPEAGGGGMGRGDSTDGSDYGGMGGGPSGAAAPLPTLSAAGSGLVSPPDDLYQPTLQAGEKDDNAEFSGYLDYRRGYSGPPVTDVDVTERHVIQVTTRNGLPVLGAEVLVYDGQDLVTALRTPGTGIVYFFPRAYPSYANTREYVVQVQKDQASETLTINRQRKDARWVVQLNTDPAEPPVRLDILILLDETGSMESQIQELKDNFLSISAQIAALPSRPDLRFAMVSYRDRGDEFVTRVFDFTPDVRDFQANLMRASALGGGDTPESLNEALHRAVWDVNWRVDNTVSLIFLVADAPPHLDYPQDYNYAQEMQSAIELGIKIHPIIADTGNVSASYRAQAEYIYRQLAQFTGGHFLFITEQDAQGQPSTDLQAGQGGQYTVGNLDALVVRLVQDELAVLFAQ